MHVNLTEMPSSGRVLSLYLFSRCIRGLLGAVAEREPEQSGER